MLWCNVIALTVTQNGGQNWSFEAAAWSLPVYMQANIVSTQIFMFLIQTKQWLLQYSARKTSTTGATVTNGNEIGSQWHVSGDKLCSSIGLHFVTQGPQSLELKSVIWFHAGGWFSWVNASTPICALVSVLACLTTQRCIWLPGGCQLALLCLKAFRVKSGRELS